MYNRIYNPNTKRLVNINSNIGLNIISLYINYMNGGTVSSEDNDNILTYWEKIPNESKSLALISESDIISDTIIDNCVIPTRDRTEFIGLKYDWLNLNDNAFDRFYQPQLFTHMSMENDYKSLDNDRYNFILFWDSTLPVGSKESYILGIIRFIYPEYGTKHIILYHRLKTKFKDLIPDTFIFSGEFIKTDNMILPFNDQSSFYTKFTPNLKTTICGSMQCSNIESDTEYKSHLTEIIKDAFNLIFKVDLNPLFSSISDANNSTDFFYNKACEQEPLQFKVYDTELHCNQSKYPIGNICDSPDIKKSNRDNNKIKEQLFNDKLRLEKEERERISALDIIFMDIPELITILNTPLMQKYTFRQRPKPKNIRCNVDLIKKNPLLVPLVEHIKKKAKELIEKHELEMDTKSKYCKLDIIKINSILSTYNDEDKDSIKIIERYILNNFLK